MWQNVHIFVKYQGKLKLQSSGLSNNQCWTEMRGLLCLFKIYLYRNLHHIIDLLSFDDPCKMHQRQRKSAYLFEISECS